MKNNQKRLSFKLDQAGLKTIRDPAWACKHAQQSQYKHPAIAFSVASWILDIHSHSAKCITSLSEKAFWKFQAPKQLDAKKMFAARTLGQRDAAKASSTFLHRSVTSSSTYFVSYWGCCYHQCDVGCIVLYCKKSHHQCAAPFLSECFILPAVKTITLSLLFKF